jgi:glycine/sarcosine N-methyltransferase
MVEIQLFRKNVDTFNAILQYARSILAEATLLTIDLDSLPVMSEELVQRWEGYAGSREFRENGIGKLLLHELNSKQGWIAGRVLDAAAGSGYEARYLASNSYDVTANELDPTWNHILTARLASESLPVEIYQYDWLGMSQHLKPLYTAVLAVGNSLSMAIGKSQRQRVVEEFYKVLKPGGKLIIDERNFPLVEQYLKRGEPYSAKSVLYDCSSVAGELTFEDRANNLIRFTLKDTESERTLGAIVVQSLPKNELLQLLKKAGFHDIITYSDLRPGKDPTAHIYTYIATK